MAPGSCGDTAVVEGPGLGDVRVGWAGRVMSAVLVVAALRPGRPGVTGPDVMIRPGRTGPGS
jgi:hypothetical protein